MVLAGKQILQQMCVDGADWDGPLPDPLHKKWQCWFWNLKCLESLKVPRCIKPDGFGESVETELHHFSDASSLGYGQCSYVRMKNSENQIACAFVMGKSRVVPVKPVTIPRLELSAAVMSVKIGSMLQQELDYEKPSQAYWSDSKVVLGYISNEARRFHVYVANRVQQIKEHTNTAQWHYVASSENPADTASRGLNADKFVNNATGLNGPEFLWKESIPQSKPVHLSDMVSPEDTELKVVKSFSCKMESFTAISLLERLEFL